MGTTERIQGREYPSEGEPQDQRHRPRRWPWIAWAMGIVVLVVLVVFRWNANRDREEFEQRIAAIRAAGQPVTAEDFAALYPDPPPERDFRLLMRSCLPAGTPPYEDPATARDSCLPELRSLTNRAALEPGLLERARLETISNALPVELLLRTDLSGFSFREVWTKGFWAPDREALGDRIFLRIDLARALAVQAAYEAELGHTDRAVTAVVRGLQVARIPSHLGLIGAVVQLAGEAMTLSVFERVLNRVSPGEADLARLQEGLSRRSDLAREMMLSERAWQIHCWMHPEVALAGGSLATRPLVERAAVRLGVLTRGYSGRLAMLDRWNRRVAATALPPREQFLELHAIGDVAFQQLRGAKTFSARLREALRLDQRLLAVTEPRTHAVLTEHALVLAQLANAQTAVAIERWRLAHPGRLPASLADLVPAFLDAVPSDPFDGQPVRYRKLPRGYLVYCVGMDLTDDGGKEGQRGENPGFDTTLTIGR